MEKSLIAVIIPSYEPTAKLSGLIRSLRSCFSNPIIIVNDGSDPVKYQKYFDDAAAYPSVTVLTHEKNFGKGRALKTAFAYCLEHDIPGAVTADSDGQHLPEDISRCMDALAETPQKLILGVRDFKVDGIPFKSKFGNVLTCSVFRVLTGRKLSDTQTGLRGISADFMKQLVDIPGERFEFETKMLWEAKMKKILYREVKISTVYEDGNSGTHFRPVRDSWLIYKTLLREIFLQFLLFGCSSFFSFLVDICMFWLFFNKIFNDIDFSFFGKLSLRLFLSVGCARCVSAFVNYTLNRNLVFKRSRGLIDKKSLVKYILLCCCMMLSSYFLTEGVLSLAKHANEVIVKICVDTFLFYITFLIQKFIVFRHNRHR